MTVANPDLDVEFQAMIENLDDDDLCCELVTECPIHGEEKCSYRARWVATMQCRAEDCDPRQVLACDPCHDDIVADGNQTSASVVLSWRPL